MSNRVLFVSARCPHSKKILLGIKQHVFLNELFKIVNIDTQPFPNYIKTVPCILINNQVITGESVFEYFGKLVEGKKEQEQREQKNQLNESDQGQCRVNDEGLLEGYCGMDGFSMISEENDDYTKQTFKSQNHYDMLDGSSDIHEQVKNMEENDNQLSQKNKGFDQDLERMQRERGEIQMGGAGNPPGPGQMGPGGGPGGGPSGGGPGGGGGGGPGGGGGINMNGPDERFAGL
jgi:hypothetical protein